MKYLINISIQQDEKALEKTNGEGNNALKTAPEVI